MRLRVFVFRRTVGLRFRYIYVEGGRIEVPALAKASDEKKRKSDERHSRHHFYRRLRGCPDRTHSAHTRLHTRHGSWHYHTQDGSVQVT